MTDLRPYRRRRDPERTPEPPGTDDTGRRAPPGAAGVFVVQQHAARRMHWDLRLEIEGVLASWAVPRGPSVDPADRRLAVRTEDHPLDYADFEGVIPAGSYGAGAMIVWDRGLWRSAHGRAPAEGLARGKLDLELLGHKLRGRFALVRTRGGEGRDWLLLAKDADAPEEGDPVTAWPESVLSGLTVEELRGGVRRTHAVVRAARRAGAPRREVDARRLRPMLAGTAEGPFSREGWLFELKYDGVRVLVAKEGSDVVVRSRTGGDRTAIYPEIAEAVAHLPVGRCVLDGELVALDERGRSSFERLQRRFTRTDPEAARRARHDVPVSMQAFDLLAAEGHDLRGCPLAARKRILSLFAPRQGVVRFADHVEGDGEALFEAAREHELEGVVAKRADSRYETGRRSRRWLKVKAPKTALLCVAGWQPGRGSRARLGSLLLAGYADGELRYAGNVGSGLSEAAIDDLLARLGGARVPEPPCTGAPDPPTPGTVYVRPELACEVRFTEVTEAGLLRQPVFVRLREDAEPAECRAPLPRAAAEAAAASAAAPAAPARPETTRPEKVFWPVEGYTKGDLLAYYEAAWPWLAPYLRDRPVVLTRYPDGIEGKHFYQKNAPEFTPDWARRETLDGTDSFVCNDLRTLLYVVNSGAIPLHVWSARVGSLERPDWLILDLDPKEAPFRLVVEVARHVHALLSELEAPHYVKTSGQDGLHVLVPLGARLDHAEAKALAEILARVVCAERPDVATVARPRAARGGKVYVDFLQNGRGKLIAAPFSVRPRPGAPVSMPLRWSQVTARLDPGRFTFRTALRHLRGRPDPLRGVLGEPARVDELLAALSARLEAGA